MTIRRLAEEARLSGATIGGGLIFLAGQVADDATLDAEGQTTDAVARRLGVSERTVRRRLRAVADLLGVGSTMEAVVSAVRAGLI